MTTTTEVLDEEYDSLPQSFKDAIETWIESLAEADRRAEDVIRRAKTAGISKADIRACGRRRLARSLRRVNHMALGF